MVERDASRPLYSDSAITQMAIDAFLLSKSDVFKSVVVRTYSMSPVAVTIGRHQRWRRVIDESACSERGWDWCRRPTGGGALLHHNEINYSVIASRGMLATVGEGEFRNVFDRIGRALAACLAEIGFSPELRVGDRGVSSHQHGLCGRSITGNEIELDGLKIVAAAQMITPTGILQHGTIYLTAPSTADRFWPQQEHRSSPDEWNQRWTDLGPRFRERDREEVAGMLEEGIKRQLLTNCCGCELTPADWRSIDAIIENWASVGWNTTR